jgi:hypothetical protein
MLPLSTGNGGSWVQFSHRDGSFSSIIWSPTTGARVVRQLINDAYARIKRMNGPLGFPTTDDMPTHDGVGRFQTFQGGLVVWHPRIGAFEVHGAISARYLAAGGTTFGYPTTDETGTPDGRGRFNHFRHLESNSTRSIYWTATTGAHEVYGLIRGHWQSLGWERSPVGYPVAPEYSPRGNRGREQHFEHGSIVWSPETGAHAVYGEVRDSFRARGPYWGYPTTEPTTTPDGRGRFQHYRDLRTNEDRSIYWSPSTGAQKIGGPIRERWAQLGWEAGHLGYPTGAPAILPTGPDDRRQPFQGGAILYTPATGAYADPMRWTTHFSGGGFRGDVAVVVDSTGRVRLDGRAECGWPAKFSYLVQSMVKSSTNQVIVLPHKGKLTAVTQSDSDRFHDDFVDGLVSADFPAFSRGSLRVDHQHSNDVTKFIGDITDGLIKWTVGELVITPGTGLILLGAAELYSALTKGGVSGGARIASGMMWLAGPAGTVFALAADGLARLANSDEPLGTHEYDVAQMVFKGTLPSREDIRISDSIGSGGKAFTFPRWDGKMVISLGDDADNPMRARDERCTHDGQLLIHELTHVWHYHNNPALMRYVGDRVFGDGDHPGSFPRGDWDSDFSQEQKCVIVDEWFARHYDPARTRDEGWGLALSGAVLDSSFVYISDQIRKRHA